MATVGGLKQLKPVDNEVSTIITKMKEQIEEKTGSSYDQFDGAQYATQVVAGTNYFISIQVDDAQYIWVRIFRSLQGEFELVSVKENQTTDQVTYF
mmetsp:Transcript_12331/g.18634  ORF Transcript_12331/g.18634 Transcript_12331/m.18634 type:complete len:96 (+) Transcript_12331:756-1043(+)